MRFGAIDAQIARCEEHLRDTGTGGSVTEFYLTQFLLVRLVAEYEARIMTLIRLRCSRGNDDRIKSFTRRGAKALLRSFAIGEIAGCLRHFGDDYGKTFRDSIDPTLDQMWHNLYTNRDAVAHMDGAQMTLRDLKEHYQKTRVVIDAVVTALEMRPKELKDLK